MLWKFCKSAFFKSHPVEMMNSKIGRMTAETTRETIKKELESEIKKDGMRKTRQRIGYEKNILEHLRRSRAATSLQIENECLYPLLERADQGFSVQGFTWEQSQAHIRAIITPEKALEIEEQIDWLQMRNTLFKSMSSSRLANAWDEIESAVKLSP